MPGSILPAAAKNAEYRADLQGEFDMIQRFTALWEILVCRVNRSDRGATAVEYGLMVALIAAVIVTAVTLIGTNLTSVFNSVAGKI